MTVIIFFVLWIVFTVAGRNKEERYDRIEYLEGLRDERALSPENFLKEKRENF